LFLHPFLAIVGIGLVSVPIIIHLLNRRRFQVVRWGAMSFLLAAYKKTRRRLELESLILLLLRALAVLLIGLAIARPLLSPDSPLAIVAGGPREVVIALDASWSMAMRDGALTSYERGIQASRAILDALKPERQDKATLLLAKQHPKMLASGSPVAARDALARANEPTFEGMDLAATLDLAAAEIDALHPELAEREGAAAAEKNAKKPSGPPITLFLVSDLQRSNFFPRATKVGDRPESAPAGASTPQGPSALQGTSGLQATSALQAAASALATRNVNIRLIDVGVGGDGPVENVGIVNVYAADDLPASGIPMEIRAAVRNFGATARANVVVNATIDGNRESPQTIETLAAGAVQEVSFATTFRDAGDHTVEIFIDEDKLTVDDRRAFAIAVRPPVRILLVDGSPDPEPEIASAGMIGLALAPPEEPLSTSPFRLVTPAPVDRVKFASQPELLEQADVVVLVNVEGFSEDQVSRLREFVEGGGSVVFVLGDRVDPASYASRLRAGRDPKSWLLPGSLMGVREVPTREHPPWRIATIEEPVAPYLRFFDPPERRVLLTEVPIYKFHALDVSEDDVKAGSRVVARYNDAEISPFMVTKEMGRGRIAVITTGLDLAPDRRWSRIADSPKTFLPLLFDLLHSIATGSREPRNALIGESLRAEVRGAPRQANLTDPGGRTERINVEKPKKVGMDRYLVESPAAAERPGIYSLEVETAVGVGALNTNIFKFAVGVEPDEGDLFRSSFSSAASAFPGIDVRLAGGLEEESAPQSEGSRNEVWRALIAAALGILVLESALATWFGRRRG
jgi:hypothetical protein